MKMAAEIRRYIQIACTLEPISYKKGCTTRYQDVTPTLKIENFIVAGINIGDAFEELAERIIENNKTNQNVYYDLCLKAQKDSLKNRGGHRINQGIIEFMFPIVISQLTHKESNPYHILKKTTGVLKKTNKQDVVYLQKMRNFAFSLWDGHHKHLLKLQKKFSNVYEFYNQDVGHFGRSIYWHFNEIANQYPILTEMLDLYYNKFMNKEKQIKADEYQKSEVCDHTRCNLNNLSDAMAYVYEKVKKEHPIVPNGIIADLIACLIYLLLSCNKEFIV